MGSKSISFVWSYLKTLTSVSFVLKVYLTSSLDFMSTTSTSEFSKIPYIMPAYKYSLFFSGKFTKKKLPFLYRFSTSTLSIPSLVSALSTQDFSSLLEFCLFFVFDFFAIFSCWLCFFSPFFFHQLYISITLRRTLSFSGGKWGCVTIFRWHGDFPRDLFSFFLRFHCINEHHTFCRQI